MVTLHNDKLIIIGALYLPDEVVVVPCGLLVKRPDVCPEGIGAEHLLVRHLDTPCDRCHLVLFILFHRYAVVPGYGGIPSLQLRDTLQDCLVFLRAAFLAQRGGNGLHAILEAPAEAAVHGLLLQGLRRRLDLQVVVPAFGLDLLQLYGALFAIISRTLLSRGCVVVVK